MHYVPLFVFLQEVGKIGMDQNEKTIIAAYDKNPFCKTCDIQVTRVAEGESELRLEVDDKHTNIYGAAHGGVLATLVDTAMGVAAASVGYRIVTLNLNLSYINSIFFCDTAVAEAKIIHKGMSTLVAEGIIKNSKGDIVVKAVGTLFVVGRFDEVKEKW